MKSTEGMLGRHARQLMYSALLICAIVALGTTGYVVIEGWEVFEAFYMTVITITTIGYGEIHPLSGSGRAFTIMLVVSSVGAVFYSLNNAARLIIEGELNDLFGRRKMEKKIEALVGHYIICGFGRMGGIVAKELRHESVSYVIIEKSKEHSEGAGDEALIIEGDATSDETLMRAGIKNARGLISVLSTDAENVYVVLSARGLNPSLFIVARAGEEGSEQKLLRAGADRVVSPYAAGALRIAHTVLKPAVVDFIEFATKSGNIDLQMEEITIKEGSALADKSLDQCGLGRDLGIIVVAIKRPDGKMEINPTFRTLIKPGDTLIVLGETGKLTELEKMAA